MLNRLFQRRRSKPPSTPETRLFNVGLPAAGINLHPDDALKVTAVWRCVSLISQAIASLPWDVYRREATGNSTHLTQDSVAWLLGHEPNEEVTAFTFRELIVQHQLIWGNGYAEIVRNRRGRPVALYNLPPDCVQPRRDENGELYYRVHAARGPQDFDTSDIFHVKGLSFDGIQGYSVVQYALNTITGSRAVDEFAARFFGQGARPSGFIKVEGEYEGERLDRLMETIKRWSGVKNAHTPMVLDQATTWEKTSVDPDEAQMLETRRFNVVEVCRIFGVPPHMAFDLEKSTQRNIEAQNREFLAYGLNPRIVPLEQEANKKLLTHEHGGRHSRMNVNEFQRGDADSRATYYKAMREMGVFSVNDIRRQEGLDTIGPEGDVRVMQMQYQPIDQMQSPESGAKADEDDSQVVQLTRPRGA